MPARRSSLMVIWKYNFDSSCITRVGSRFEFFLYFITLPIFCYRVFSLTWPASMQICWNKRKRLHKKRFQLPEDLSGTPIWPPWRHVKTLYCYRSCTRLYSEGKGLPLCSTCFHKVVDYKSTILLYVYLLFPLTARCYRLFSYYRGLAEGWHRS